MQTQRPVTRLPRIVVVGCGFAGAAAVKTLCRALGPRAAVTAFNPSAHLYNYPILPRSLMRPVPEARISVPLARVLGGAAVDLRIARVRAVDAARHEVRTDEGVLAFDALVLACGARARALDADDGACVLFPKSMRHLDRLRAWLGAVAEGVAGAPPADGVRHRVAVAGGGLTGVEFAVAVRELADALCRAAGTPRDRIHVTLYERQGRVARECAGAVSAHVVAALASLGVEVRCDAEVRRALPGHILVGAAEEPADVVLACVGSRPNLKGLALEGLGDVSAGVVVDTALRAPAAPAVYVVGDAMRWVEPGASNLKRGAEAIRQGRLAARNVARTLAGREPLAYCPRVYTGIMLGRRNALLAVGERRLAGALAGQVKAYLERRGPP